MKNLKLFIILLIFILSSCAQTFQNNGLSEKEIENLDIEIGKTSKKYLINNYGPPIFENLFNGNNENLTTKISNNNLILHGVNGRLVKAVTLNQIKIVELISKKDLVFAIGPAGTGKTYTSVALAVKFLKEKKVKRIILTRPAVEAGENLGFLPGDMNDKLDPYMQPLYDALRDMIPKEKLKKFIESGTIQIAPLA
ncbi:MAG: hypothetical protein CBD59_00450, partial [Alphaproteobacteria bacterium TMED199]